MKTFSAAALALSVISLCAALAAVLYVHEAAGSMEESAGMARDAESRATRAAGETAALSEIEARLDAIEAAVGRFAAGNESRTTREAPAHGEPAPGADASLRSQDFGLAPSGPDPRDSERADGAQAAGSSGTANRAETFEEKVKRLESEVQAMRKKVEDREQEPGKPKFDQFAAKLDLTPAQAQTARDIIEKGQSEVLDMMKTPLDDGTILADQLADAFASAMDGSEEGKARVGAVFKTLISEKIPGSNETYFEAIERVNRAIASRMDTVLNVDQQRKFREWGVSPTDIELQNGPFERHIIEYIKSGRGNNK